MAQVPSLASLKPPLCTWLQGLPSAGWATRCLHSPDLFWPAASAAIVCQMCSWAWPQYRHFVLPLNMLLPLPGLLLLEVTDSSWSIRCHGLWNLSASTLTLQPGLCAPCAVYPTNFPWRPQGSRFCLHGVSMAQNLIGTIPALRGSCLSPSSQLEVLCPQHCLLKEQFWSCQFPWLLFLFYCESPSQLSWEQKPGNRTLSWQD